MKTVLRRMAGVLAAFLLFVCPVGAVAADLTFPEDENGAMTPPAENGMEGGTFFGIMEVSKWKYLTVIVKDSVTALPLPDVTVKLYQGISDVPITGSDGAFATNQEGKIVFQLVKDDTISYRIEIAHPGFEAYVGGSFTLPNRLTEQTVELVPVYHTVSYFSGDNGSISPSAHTEQVRWGGSPKAPPQTVPNYHHRFLHWTLDDVPVSLPGLKVKEDLSLYAQFGLLPQHNVYYVSGGHGSIIGEAQELVWEGEKPVNVPETEANEDYFFKGWQEQGKPFEFEFDPATVSIMGETTFIAVFEEGSGGDSELPPPLFPSSSEPTETLPEPPPDDEPPRAWFTGTSSSTPEQTAVVDLDPPPVPNAVPEILAPVVKLLNLDVGLCWLHWLVLVLCLVTGLAEGLRLWFIQRQTAKSKETEKPDIQTRIRRHRWMVFTEWTLGAVCMVLWGVLFAIRICGWDILALLLWAVVLGVGSVLLVRGERRLRRLLLGEPKEDEIGKGEA